MRPKFTGSRPAWRPPFRLGSTPTTLRCCRGGGGCCIRERRAPKYRPCLWSRGASTRRATGLRPSRTWSAARAASTGSTSRSSWTLRRAPDALPTSSTFRRPESSPSMRYWRASWRPAGSGSGSRAAPSSSAPCGMALSPCPIRCRLRCSATTQRAGCRQITCRRHSACRAATRDRSSCWCRSPSPTTLSLRRCSSSRLPRRRSRRQRHSPSSQYSSARHSLGLRPTTPSYLRRSPPPATPSRWPPSDSQTGCDSFQLRSHESTGGVSSVQRWPCPSISRRWTGRWRSSRPNGPGVRYNS
mmetsp:Transcript_33969/g.109745  ORF Transcript_33969/g.109745 Transcript_33969/m.109745 type:complete len:300 (-) Transcript_33969:65-964(-)